MDIFWKFEHFKQYFQQLFTLIYNYLLASLKLQTNFENADWNSHYGTLLCDTPVAI